MKTKKTTNKRARVSKTSAKESLKKPEREMRVSKKATETLSEKTVLYMDEVGKTASALTKHRGDKTIKEQDVHLATRLTFKERYQSKKEEYQKSKAAKKKAKEQKKKEKQKQKQKPIKDSLKEIKVKPAKKTREKRKNYTFSSPGDVGRIAIKNMGKRGYNDLLKRLEKAGSIERLSEKDQNLIKDFQESLASEHAAELELTKNEYSDKVDKRTRKYQVENFSKLHKNRSVPYMEKRKTEIEKELKKSMNHWDRKELTNEKTALNRLLKKKKPKKSKEESAKEDEFEKFEKIKEDIKAQHKGATNRLAQQYNEERAQIKKSLKREIDKVNSPDGIGDLYQMKGHNTPEVEKERKKRIEKIKEEHDKKIDRAFDRIQEQQQIENEFYANLHYESYTEPRRKKGIET